MKPTVYKVGNGGQEEAITIMINEEEEDLEDLIIVEDEENFMQVEAEPVHPLTKHAPMSHCGKERLECPRTLMIPRALSKPCSSRRTLFFRAHTWGGCEA